MKCCTQNCELSQKDVHLLNVPQIWIFGEFFVKQPNLLIFFFIFKKIKNFHITFAGMSALCVRYFGARKKWIKCQGHRLLHGFVVVNTSNAPLTKG